MGCGRAGLWPSYLLSHPTINVLGIDIDPSAIEVGLRMHQGNSQIELRVADAQEPLPEELFDAIVALGSIERIADRDAFLRTIGGSLKSGGVAYLNYGASHPRSLWSGGRLKAALSYFLAAFGYETAGRKRVNDAEFRNQIERQGFQVLQIRKHNLSCLKEFMKDAPDNAIQDWFDFEERLLTRFSLADLDKIMLSTTFVVLKP